MTVEILINVLIAVCLALGTFFIIVTAIGLIRFPDAYTRAHAASKSATLGVMFILIGVFIHFWYIEGNYNPRILLGILFLFITGPIGGHIMARAAYFSGVKPWSGTVKDDLKPEYERKKKEFEEQQK
ncbi:Multiple resistance and pH homeostasis protein G [Kurthia zopfii]|uniref:Multiple resistance and pH homeostasis protein G n=1 Tax=Kurthia zopfii TaxID=1650 RepID=A0A8B4QCJ1_9BACL|nr:multisubunit sodium/proton antiporter MrpG subunit [Kurthia zopfii]STX10436.1 Multiple resistance and pH homeostasis protein G [Kurthia zopfii]